MTLRQLTVNEKNVISSCKHLNKEQVPCILVNDLVKITDLTV